MTDEGPRADATTDRAPLRERLLVDECLSPTLVAEAKARGFGADHVTWIGRAGMQDWNLVPFAVGADYLVATNNRRDFLRLYAGLDLHPGLVVVVPDLDRDDQRVLFGLALDALAARGGDAVNLLVEVFSDGEVRARAWHAGDHDPSYVASPGRGP